MATRGVNKVILIGNLGNDPEVRYMPSGGAVANVSIATSETWKDKQSGDQQERTEWHRVVFFNRLAEIVGEYLRKGAKVYVEGSLRTRKWQGQDGQDRYTTEIVASEMQMLDSRGAGGGGGQGGSYGGGGAQGGGYGGGGGGYSGGGQNNPGSGGGSGDFGPQGGQSNGPSAGPPPQSGPGDFDDDIPF